MDPIDLQRCHTRLLTFLDHKSDHQVAFSPLIIVQHLSIHFCFQESVCQVQILHGFPVGLHQPSAESPRRCESLRINDHAAAQQIGVEILVSGDLDSQQRVPVAALHAIRDHLFASLSSALERHLVCARCVVHFRIEVTVTL